MKQIILPLILLCSFSTLCFAKEYGKYDPKKVIIAAKTESGTQYSLDLQYLDTILEDLTAHAGGYPPKFSSENERNAAKEDVTYLSDMLNIITNTPKPAVEILKRTSLLNTIGHNLDIAGTAERADRDYQKLLEQLPNDSGINFSYGSFLGGSNQAKKALPYLKKAVETGYNNAYFALGMSYLSLKENKKALESFEQYQKYNPNSKEVVSIIEAIKSGKVRYKTDTIDK